MPAWAPPFFHTTLEREETEILPQLQPEDATNLRYVFIDLRHAIKLNKNKTDY
jgi:hypothetical protein